MIIASIGFLVIGIILLYFGAEWIVKGAVHIASNFGVSPMIIGLTIVAFGTSLPELIVSIKAVIENSESIAIGNIVGSNIANVGLVLGLSFLIFPHSVDLKTTWKNLLFYIFVLIIFVIFISDGVLSRVEGLFLFVGFLGYTIRKILKPTDDVEERDDKLQSTISSLLFIAVGILALYFGSELFVKGAVRLARHLGITEIVIGMSVVAFGTSLPELATSVVAAYKREGALSLGNIIGSNLFNILLVMGIAPLIQPIKTSLFTMNFELIFLFVYGLVLFPLGIMKETFIRITSAMLLISYIFFIYFIYT